MTRKQWLKEITGDYFETALRKYDASLREGKLKVVVDKVFDIGSPRYAIIVEYTTFYMAAFRTKKEALALCKACGWKVYAG